MCRVQKHRKRHLGDEEATAKQMYIKASEQASFARRRGNRQPGSSLVLSETGKAPAWLCFASRVPVVLVGLGKGRGGVPGHGALFLLLLCCVRIIFFHFLSKL